MIYTRIIVDNCNIEDIIEKLNLVKYTDFAFYDLIYMNKNGATITEDTLKVRVILKNEYNTTPIFVIRKSAPVINGVKEDKILLNKEFKTLEEALNYVDKNLKDEYDYKFKLEKTGVSYKNKDLMIWVEDIKDLGMSIEFGSNNQNVIEEALTYFDIKERLTESVPEYMYEKVYKK